MKGVAALLMVSLSTVFFPVDVAGAADGQTEVAVVRSDWKAFDQPVPADTVWISSI